MKYPRLRGVQDLPNLTVLNQLIRRYRPPPCDYFVHEVSTCEVPIWHVRGMPVCRCNHIATPLSTSRPRIVPKLLMPYKTSVERQINYPPTLIDRAALESMDPTFDVPGEECDDPSLDRESGVVMRSGCPALLCHAFGHFGAVGRL
jgi:hypothetical protein